ncbi:spore protease YyaC [Blautia sp. MSJ-19]|uniref:spore protease YyaC n=1 Tax=Blautia sp. MSJ-19 TaxID=2841517 RepID=UPI001C0EF46F|nr:spore protease YyaC [Blautia sp. MSJ-19]MBU5482495.1 spore protease YyaC [Blautia sp. MSJ-19]
MTFYINANHRDCSRKISALLQKCILEYPGQWSELIFLCIGSDRVTGDCLGPYIGQQLSTHHYPGIYTYGTLTHPVHALNLIETCHTIKQRHPTGLVIAIDASLGQKKHLGYVTIAHGALHPGAAVHKKLPPVGHIHITGIVNIAGMLEQLTLQTTRLSTVISIADQITGGILLMIPQSDFFMQTL